jgi:hypothetical protein
MAPVRLACHPPASSTFLSEQTSRQQSASNTFLSEQISTSHQPPAKRTGSVISPYLTPCPSLTPGQNARAFGSPSGDGGWPQPCVLHRVRSLHIRTPDTAPPVPLPSPSEMSNVSLRLLQHRLRYSSPSRRRAPPSSVHPIQAHRLPAALPSSKYPHLCVLVDVPNPPFPVFPATNVSIYTNTTSAGDQALPPL